MKTFRELRQLAAEYEAERLSKTFDVVIVQRRDESAVSSIHKIPAIFERSELARHEREVKAAASRGLDPSQIAPPVALLDFSAWAYYPSCPKCLGRRLLLVGQVDHHLNGRAFSDAVFAQENPEVEARCARAHLPVRGRDRNCGWAGKAKDLAYPCFGCGMKSPSSVDGLCSGCRKNAKVRSAKTSKKGGRKKKGATIRRAGKAPR